MKQSTFRFKNQNSSHGAKNITGKRKRARPLSAKLPLHLIVKARCDFFAHRELIENTTLAMAEKFGIKIFDYAVAWNHVHVAIQIPGREYYVKFIRALTGLLARQLGKKLWLEIPFTKIVPRGRAFRNLLDYIMQNREEALGWRAYRPRGRKAAPA